MNNIGDFDPRIETGTIPEMKEVIVSEMKDGGVIDEDPFTEDSWVVLKELGYGSTEKDKKAEIKTDSKALKEKIGGKKKVGPKKSQKVGICSTILLIVQEKGPITKKDILKKMVSKFPDRDEKAMGKTMSAQVPQLLNSRHNAKIVGNDKKEFYIKK